MKHLVIDVRNALPSVDGIHTYLSNIVPALVERGRETGRFRTTLICHPDMPTFWAARAPHADQVVSSVAPMKPPQNWQLLATVRSLAPDLYFYSAHDPPIVVGAPLVFTIHDVTMFRLKPYFETLDRSKRFYNRVVMEVALRRARAVFTVSETAKSEIGSIFGSSFLPKINVVPHGIARGPTPSAHTRDRFLYVGTDRIHKNLPRLVRAYARARRLAGALPRLEIVGGLRRPGLLRELIRSEGVEHAVVLRGHIDQPSLEEAYASAIALLFPSLAEGFGLPILEAMVRGIPVLTSNISACAEVAGGAALTVDPHDIDDIARGIAVLASDEVVRERLTLRGRARADGFQWARTAKETAAVVEATF